MAVYGYPALYALFVWWFSTGLIIWLDNLHPRTFRWSMSAGTAVFAVSLWQVAVTAGDGSVWGAYAAFTWAVLAWGWQEMGFFMGFVTGPRRIGSPPGVSEWQRFVHGVNACLYHELAIVATAAIIVCSTRGAVNQVGTWTFLVLWAMRASAKLNFFLGVLNLGEEFIPAHLGYLKSYLRRRPMNGLFPISVTAGTVVIALLMQQAATPGIGEAAAAGLTFVITMLTLAIIEHWVLILPIPFAKLWSWVLTRRRPAILKHNLPKALSLRERVG
jgi:putative photosynthetic complex assembly protein 2